MDGRKAFDPNAQSPEVVQSCEGPLDAPPGLSKATAMRLAAAADLRGDAGSVQWLAIFVVIVAAIGLHDDGL